MSKSLSVEKLEDRGSDCSEGEDGQITLSLAHLDSDNFLGSDSDSDENCSIQSIAQKSPYITKEPKRKSPREATRTASRVSTTQSTSKPKVTKTYPPAWKSISDARSRRAKAREEDERSSEVQKLDSESFKIRKGHVQLLEIP